MWGSRRRSPRGWRALSGLFLVSCCVWRHITCPPPPDACVILVSLLFFSQMIRAVLTYIQKKAKESGNSVLQYLACCCACCFWCLENCIRYINKNAYVQVGNHVLF